MYPCAPKNTPLSSLTPGSPDTAVLPATQAPLHYNNRAQWNVLPASRRGAAIDYAWDEPSLEHVLLARLPA